MTEAAKKSRMKAGRARFSEKPPRGFVVTGAAAAVSALAAGSLAAVPSVPPTPAAAPAPATFSLRAITMASTSVMGMMASVRVSFTMVASSSALAPGCMPSQAAAAAVTDEVSFTAVPANRPKPSLDMPSALPKVGKMSAAVTLNRKMTEMAWATCSSFALMTGAVAAMALPPQMEDPTAMSVAMAESMRSTLYRM